MEPLRCPNCHVFHCSQAVRQKPVDQGLGASIEGSMGSKDWQNALRRSGTSTVVWRKWKLLCICLRDAWVTHGCWDATGGHHAGGHAQALPSHHQRPLLHLLLLLLHLPLPQVLAQDLPLPLCQHLCIDGALGEKQTPINNPSEATQPAQTSPLGQSQRFQFSPPHPITQLTKNKAGGHNLSNTSAGKDFQQCKSQ